MDNILYRFIADRNTPILDNIERYCVSENKDELTVTRIVFYFLEGIKPLLDDSFVNLCMGYITKDADENTKKGLSLFNVTQIRILKGHEDADNSSKEILKRVEGGKGNITELMYLLINSDKTEWEKLCLLKGMQSRAKDKLYMFQITSLYTSEESGIEVGYINHLGDRITHIYTRSEFIQDIELVDAQYDDLAKKKLNKAAEDESGNLAKHKLISDIIKPRIITDEKKAGRIFNYLESASSVIREVRAKNATIGALCLAFHQFDIFKNKPSFTALLGILSEYWGVKKPAYNKPGEYESKLIELKNRHLFLDQGIV